MMIDVSAQRICRIISLTTLLVFVLSLFWLGTMPKWVDLFPAPPADKLVHLVVFGFITALLWVSLLRPRPFIIFVIMAMIGAADELHQLHIPGRTASFADFAADLCGIVLVIAILKYTQRKSVTLT
jgi:hypothetical protein